MRENIASENTNMAKYSEAQKRAVKKYNQKKYDDIKLHVPKGYRDSVIRVAAELDGVSINEYMLTATVEKIKKYHPDIEGVNGWKISTQ